MSRFGYPPMLHRASRSVWRRQHPPFAEEIISQTRRNLPLANIWGPAILAVDSLFGRAGVAPTSRLMMRTSTALRKPIASLISKSEKAQQKLAPGTWQHTMLRDNLKALHIASVLMNRKADDTGNLIKDDLREALRAFASMASKTEKAQAKFSPGTSQHTLQRNRLKALRIAGSLIRVELAGPAEHRVQRTRQPKEQRNTGSRVR